MSSKRKTMQAHAKLRFRQRAGLSLTPEIHKQFLNQIWNRQAEFVEKQSCRVSIFLVTYDNQKLKVAYDKDRKLIITCLPACEEHENPWDVIDRLTNGR